MGLDLERWKGKIAVVTGASRGIGAAITQKLAEAGVNVVGMARKTELIDDYSKAIQTSGKIFSVKVDISKRDSILEGFKWIKKNVGSFHILINNAGILLETSLMDGDDDIWKQVFDVNVLGLCIATREAVKQMTENKIDGHIIHINSVAAHLVTGLLPNSNVYSASKHAVRALGESLRLELNQIGSNIKISCVSPGPVDTDIVKDLRRKYDSVNKIFEKAMKPSDVADTVMFVLSTPPNVQIQDVIMRPLGM